MRGELAVCKTTADTRERELQVEARTDCSAATSPAAEGSPGGGGADMTSRKVLGRTPGALWRTAPTPTFTATGAATPALR